MGHLIGRENIGNLNQHREELETAQPSAGSSPADPAPAGARTIGPDLSECKSFALSFDHHHPLGAVGMIFAGKGVATGLKRADMNRDRMSGRNQFFELERRGIKLLGQPIAYRIPSAEELCL